MDELFIDVIKNIYEKGESVSPRNINIREICGYHLKLHDPRNRIIYNEARQFSVSFAIGEFLWYLSGRNDLSTMLSYSKNYHKFSDDLETLNGAYGYRLFNSETSISQFDRIASILSKDKDSRQAVMSIYSDFDLDKKSKDIPCTCTIQYLIRRGKLNCIVYMRSNDVFLGMPYDIFSFTMMQELMANKLGVDVGWYEHVVGSMHIYETNIKQCHEILQLKSCSDLPMQKMPGTDDINALLNNEKILRSHSDQELETLREQYWIDFQNILKIKFNGNKNNINMLPVYFQRTFRG